MNSVRILFYSGYIVSFLFLFSCAAVQTEKEEIAKPSVATEDVSAYTEQELKSIEKFNEILIVSSSSKDRKDVLPQMEKLYKEIISDYPDAPLAQESYWRMIEIYVKEYSPPRFEQAETLYSSFISKYPESPLAGIVSSSLAIGLYRHKEWERLLKLSNPVFQTYVESGTSRLPLMIFMYAEANFQLGNFENAENGFRLVIEKFPQLNENKRAKERLNYIRQIR